MQRIEMNTIFKGNIAVNDNARAGAAANNIGKKVIFKNWQYNWLMAIL